jgi:L-galactose dehydrogenase
MQYTTLGRTGLRVSRVGLGCGGPSRLGQSYGSSLEDSKRVIARALELGINFFDTAESYGTEAVLGEALRGTAGGREALVSTKKGVWDSTAKRFCTADEMREGIDASLRRLGREHIDVYHVHGLEIEHVEHALGNVVPVLEAAQRAGKIRHLAVSEAFMSDTRHATLRRLLEQTNVFDVMMVGFNFLNPSARRMVLPVTERLGIGTLIMFAVRRALTNPTRLREVLTELMGRGELPGELERDNPLGFLGDVRDAAYRFCMHEPGADLVLTGTGSVEHLEQNVKSLSGPALSEAQLGELGRLFGRVESVSGH